MIEVLVICITVVIVVSTASHAFHSWLRQRERERLSSTDKADLEKQLSNVNDQIRALKSSISGVRHS